MTKTSTTKRHRLLERYYPETHFGGFSRADCLVAFYSRVHALLTPSAVVLDVGCGRGQWQDAPKSYARDLRLLKGKCQKVVGLDLSEAGRSNQSLDEFRLLPSPSDPWPVEDASIDVLVADSVVEHLEDPLFFFTECHRVLKPGGVVCLRTYNAWNYTGLISRLVPNRLHASVLKVAQPDRKVEDVFPTFYRCNTTRKMRKFMREASLDGVAYTYEGPPKYLSFSSLAYRLGVFHQRYAWEMFKWNVFGFARRPDKTA